MYRTPAGGTRPTDRDSASGVTPGRSWTALTWQEGCKMRIALEKTGLVFRSAAVLYRELALSALSLLQPR